MRPTHLLYFLGAGLVLLSMAVAGRCAEAASSIDPFQLIIARQRTLLLASPGLPRDTVSAWATALTADGRWADIDYDDQQRGNWKTGEHLQRVRALARVLAEGASDGPGMATVEAAARRALVHWVGACYKNPNWWQNDIGVPQYMGDIIVLLGARLDGSLRPGAMSVLRQYTPGRAGEGANTVWRADLALLDGALSRDPDRVASAAMRIAGEIVSGGVEGLQRDFSFFQHGSRLQQFHYGRAFFSATVRTAWLLRDTPWALAPEKIDLLAAYAREGSAWMCRGTVTVPGPLDRAVSRPGALAWGDMRRELNWLRDLAPAQAAAIEKMGQRQEEGGALVAGFRGFPATDFAAYHDDSFSFFLKTVSARTELTETLNGENLQGRRLGWGDHYLVRDGREYLDLPPVWDWKLLPGVTASTISAELQRQSLVGMVSDGLSGLAAMDYRLRGAGGGELSARKLWAVHGGVVVALIGDLRADPLLGPVRTALDQCRLRGVVSVGTAQGQTVLKEAPEELRDVRWIHHAGFLYVPLGTEPVSFTLGPATGSWKAINHNHSATPVTEAVFLPVLEHGREPAGLATGFAVSACRTPAEAAERMSQPLWRILRNDANAQAVQFPDGTLLAAFYAPGKIEEAGTELLMAEQPCLMLVAQAGVWVSDPLRGGGTCRGVVAGRSFSVICPAEGGSVRVALTAGANLSP